MKVVSVALLALCIFSYFSIYHSQLYRAFDHDHANFIQDPFLIVLGENYNKIPSSLSATEVESLISHLSGFLPLHHSERQDFPSVPLFKKPKANVLFLLEGLGHEYFSGNFIEVPLKVLNLKKGGKYSTIAHGDAVSSLSLLTTLVTGSPLEKHGILSKFWKNSQGEVQHAFAGKENEPFEASMSDVLLQTSRGKSLLLSFCADQAITSALSPRQSLLQAVDNHNVLSISWNGEGFASVIPSQLSSEVPITKDGLKKLMPGYFNKLFSSSPVKITYNENQGILSVSVPNHGIEHFDLGRMDDFLLVSEIAYSYHLVQILRTSRAFNTLVNDSSLDLLSFGFSSLQNVVKTGVYSSRTLAAVYLIDAALYQISNELNELYDSRVSTEVISLGSSLSGLDLPYAGKYVLVTSQDMSDPATDDSGYYTEEDVGIYQICVWGGLVLILAMLGAVYTLVCMQVHRDPLIYRQTFK